MSDSFNTPARWESMLCSIKMELARRAYRQGEKMLEQNKWVSDDINRRLCQGFHDTIHHAIAQRYDVQHAQDIDCKILSLQSKIEEEYAGWIDDEPSQFHLTSMALVLAGYRTLLEWMPKEESLALLTSAMTEPNRQEIRDGVRYALDNSSDPMKVIVEASKQREEFFFGRTFTFERHQDDDQAYILHVKRCFYHQFALANDVLELMQILCEVDWVWAGAIEPAKHGFSFELPTTLGYGADMCRFCFRRLTK